MSFEPKDEVGEATKCVMTFKDTPYGGLITWDQINSVLGRDVQLYHGGWNEAIKRLVRDHDRVLISVPDIGYRVATPEEIEDVVRKRTMKTIRQAFKRNREIKSALKHVSPEQKRRLMDMQNLNSRALTNLRTIRRRKPDDDSTREVEEAVLESRQSAGEAQT